MVNEIQGRYKIKSTISKIILLIFFFTNYSFAGDIDFSVFIKDADQEKRFLSNRETIPLSNEVQLQVYSKQAGILEIYYSSEATDRTSLLKEPLEVGVGDLIVLPAADSYFPMDLQQGNVHFEFGFIGDSEKIIKTYNFYAHDLDKKDFSNLTDNPVSYKSYNANYINNLTSNKPSISFSEKSNKKVYENSKKLKTQTLRGFEDVFKKTSVSTVLIFAEDENKEGFTGSGVYLKDGTIITNLHVIENSNEILVYPYNSVLDSEGNYLSYVANVLKVSPDNDLALLSINEKIDDYLPLAKDCNVEVASDVHAVGHPVGHYWTYTKGYVSQVRPDYEWSYDDDNKKKAEVIQTQTPINPGNSGGPLVNSNSDLIGINSFTMPESPGINFAVSCNEIKTFLKKDNDFKGWDTIKASKTNAKEPEWKCFDDNKDGKDDVCTQDYNQNGVIDTYIWDQNYDGIYDYFGGDDNENKILEYTILLSEDGTNPFAKDGYDIYYFDSDEDGVNEKIGYDYDFDQEIDKYVDI